MSEKMMNAWVLFGEKDISIEKRAVPAIKSDEVLIKVKQVGICGSDLAYYRSGKVGNFTPSRPFVLGHEFSGDVVKVGSEVKSLKENDRVAVDPSMNCGTCEYCQSDRSNLCSNMTFLGSAMYVPPVDGAFREYIVMPAKNCFKLPDEISYEVGALLEPMSVAYYALKRAGGVEGKTVLVSGAGTIGQLILTIAIALGAEKVCVADPVLAKRDIAIKQGAYCALDPAKADFIDRAKEIAPEGFHIVLEASGSVHALRQGIHLAKIGGTIIQVGILPPEEVIPVGLILFKELNYAGSFRFNDVYNEVLTLCSFGKLNVKGLISRTFPFIELDRAIQFAGNSEDTIKTQVKV
ncbi:MAG: L-idonate 5-dehydrogenase [Bacteroidetes bacterium]|nr:L-idonate 5-dehydrogenase [Bacteroidota bacterium]